MTDAEFMTFVQTKAPKIRLTGIFSVYLSVESVICTKWHTHY